MQNNLTPPTETLASKQPSFVWRHALIDLRYVLRYLYRATMPDLHVITSQPSMAARFLLLFLRRLSWLFRPARGRRWQFRFIEVNEDKVFQEFDLRILGRVNRQLSAVPFNTTSNLTTCPDCGRSVSKEASVCPQCGKRLQSIGWTVGTVIFWFILIMMLLGGFITFCSWVSN